MDSNHLIERVLDKVEVVDKRIDNIDVTLAKQHEQLAIHIKRTEQNEAQIKHINRHVHMVEGALKLFGVLSVVLGLLKLIGLF